MNASRALPRAPRAILADLDGTLVDSAPDIANAANAALLAAGRTPVSESEVRAWVGNGAAILMARCLARRLDAPAPDARSEGLLGDFLEHYTRAVCVESSVYPGVREGVRALLAGGAQLACVTNKPQAHAEKLLDGLQLLDSFQVVLGADAVTRGKPDPEPVETALERLGVGSGDAILVGDSVNDVLAARAANVAVVCVSYGYNHGTDIRLARPDAVVDSLAELPALLAASRA